MSAKSEPRNRKAGPTSSHPIRETTPVSRSGTIARSPAQAASATARAAACAISRYVTFTRSRLGPGWSLVNAAASAALLRPARPAREARLVAGAHDGPDAAPHVEIALHRHAPRVERRHQV